MDVTVLDRLLQIGELFERDMATHFAGSPLTPQRVQVLWELARGGSCAQHELAARLGVSPRHVTTLVDVLEAGGYVRRSPHPTDRRSIFVALTATAEDTMHEMQLDHEELSATLLEAVAPEDRAAVERGVTAIAERLAELVAADEARRREEARADS
ncbi:MarR family winged helix-turn-helix transcriptional regulator [Agromyces silvae]|uniref:MarR family winged helix-turn-helix transcriptional regulator n=1 Tax=Agromyces silvae TaxID=3388266 RepID=UPI00280B4895|nr:MarR family winged helix-turn-helix transcriptional regulator [Agromyces protaetiae]